MNSSREIRRKEKPLEFKEEIRWFAKSFHRPNTKRASLQQQSMPFQTMIWDKPGVANRTKPNQKPIEPNRLEFDWFGHRT